MGEVGTNPRADIKFRNEIDIHSRTTSDHSEHHPSTTEKRRYNPTLEKENRTDARR